MKSVTLPRDWVPANIVPVHKKGVASNYRSISLTSVVKLTERIIHLQLHAWRPVVIFRSHRSTTHLLLEATYDWVHIVELRQSYHCLLLDFS